ncbi:protease inhibitor I42 family protein [Nocardia terpenica]|uniref:protease inhibitor I42 family protein n=1 Tax=Nocardia terpenica TaxID=455432 RepID=UPI001893728C|nr:protease inhibitor I42 family protein [Nocardia terpenica]MBF6063947.1 protease inhibitor I42 family protein [Nocardia terpenica]MBF6107817.1 protease inhibitor I42 family protein [Nocardia terpenica]MBF6114885.1 protease inhibitor I42 family protein [Nocardia terpenica]MBF6121128.1 protease inhibitor I42 family protein [Nocardia terpenica]MBF6153330.1 protease inhibitor I42 family protein [Nocardia terpenica]
MRIPLLIVALGLTLAACGTNHSGAADPTSAAAPPPTTAAAPPVNVGADGNGKDVTLAVGQNLVVTLAANHTTGYSWQTQDLDQKIVKQDGDPEYHPAVTTSNPPIGSGGTSVWHFTAASPGTTTLILNYARSWEQNTAPAEHFTTTIHVR